MRLPDHPLAEPGETTWESALPGMVLLQRRCDSVRCDAGLVWGANGVGVLLCARCAGSGFVTRMVSAETPRPFGVSSPMPRREQRSIEA